MSNILIGLSLVFMVFSHWQAFQMGGDRVLAKWNKEREESYVTYQEALDAERKKRIAQQNRADQIKVESDNEISRLNSNVERLAAELRNRPKRPATKTGGVSEATGPASAGCTGARLYQQDAEFLAGIASSCQRTQVALNQCVKAYNSLGE